MAQYLMSVLHDSDSLAPPEEMAAIDVFNEQLQADGHWVFAAGLASPGSATVVARASPLMSTCSRWCSI